MVGFVTAPAEGGGVSFLPAIWTASGVAPLSTTGLDGDVSPVGISADGRVIVGSAKVAGVLHAVRWEWRSNSVSVLPAPEGAIDSEASAASGDGSFISGASYVTETSHHGLRWTPRGLEDLGPGGGGDIGADSSVIVSGQQIWDAANGWRDLRDIVSDTGADLTGWAELSASSVSADGKVVVGSAQYLGAPGVSGFRAFIIELP